MIVAEEDDFEVDEIFDTAVVAVDNVVDIQHMHYEYIDYIVVDEYCKGNDSSWLE